MCKFYQIVYEELIWKFHEKPHVIRYLNPEMTRRFDLGERKKIKRPAPAGAGGPDGCK